MALGAFPINPGYIVVAVIGIALGLSWRKARRERESSETPADGERSDRP